VNDPLWASIADLYDADLCRRLQYCWDDLDLLDRSLKAIAKRLAIDEPRLNDVEQTERIGNLIFCIELRVRELLLSRALHKSS